MMGLCCPCMLYAQIKQRVDYLNAYARPDPTRGGSGVDLNCMVWVAVHSATGCGPALQVCQKQSMIYIASCDHRLSREASCATATRLMEMELEISVQLVGVLLAS